jgi:hypothetical protein
VADIDAASGTLATAEIFFCLAPGMTTSVISLVYCSLNGSPNRSRAAVRSFFDAVGLIGKNRDGALGRRLHGLHPCRLRFAGRVNVPLQIA